ncbi:MAG: SdpI family protein [Cellulosilyticaceae bacterium]
MKNKQPLLLASLVLSILSFIATCFIYTSLPSEIPIHFNISGEIDNYGPRITALLLGAMPFLFLVLFYVIPKFDPKKKAYSLHQKAYCVLYFGLTLLLISMHWASLLISLNINLSISIIVPCLIGVFFIAIGNFLPQVRQNYTLGIRLPWSLENEHNWRYTHRVGGYSFIFSGILFIVSTFFPYSVQTIICIFAIIIMLLIPAIASFLYYKKHEN